MSSIAQFTDATFEREVLESDRPVLVDFWAPWCRPCRALGRTIEEIGAEYAGKITVGKLNVDENPKTAARFGIRSIPTVVLFKAGEAVETLVGVQPRHRYADALEHVAA